LIEHSQLALTLTFLAGLTTGIGGLIGLSSRRFSTEFITMALGFSAGAMVYVSLVEILPKARLALQPLLGAQLGYGCTVLAFFAGILLMALVDGLLPTHPAIESIQDLAASPAQAADKLADKLADRRPDQQSPQRSKLLRMGVFSALALFIHNFPEGLATFLGALENPKVGLSIAVAIAIHNIPEGLAVSAPVFFATRSRSKAFWASFLSGMAEPLGGLMGFFLFRAFPNPLIFGLVFAAVAGVMVYVSLDELLPAATGYGNHRLAIASLIAGMFVMAASLVLLV
jgi:ZIP family zinc transporter